MNFIYINIIHISIVVSLCFEPITPRIRRTFSTHKHTWWRNVFYLFGCYHGRKLEHTTRKRAQVDCEIFHEAPLVWSLSFDKYVISIPGMPSPKNIEPNKLYTSDVAGPSSCTRVELFWAALFLYFDNIKGRKLLPAYIRLESLSKISMDLIETLINKFTRHTKQIM